MSNEMQIMTALIFKQRETLRLIKAAMPPGRLIIHYLLRHDRSSAPTIVKTNKNP